MIYLRYLRENTVKIRESGKLAIKTVSVAVCLYLLRRRAHRVT